WLRRLHDEIHTTSVFVTHDQEEAFEVADQVVVMGGGRVEQVGTPKKVFDQPASPFVMNFLGNVNVFHGRVQGGRAILGGLELEYPDYPHDEARPVRAYIRPHELDIEHPGSGGSGLRAQVLHVNPAGSVARVQVLAEEFDLVVNVDLSLARFAELGLRRGDAVHVVPQRVRIFGAA